MNVDCARHGKSLQMILPGISTSHAQRWTRTLGPDVSRWLTSRHCRFHQSLSPQAIIEMSQWLSHCLACNRGQIRRETEPRSRAWSEKKKTTIPSFPGCQKSPLAPELSHLQGKAVGARVSKMKSVLCLKGSQIRASFQTQVERTRTLGSKTEVNPKPQFSHRSAVCPWESHLTHLGLNFLNIKWCKLMPTWQDFVRLKQDQHVKQGTQHTVGPQ